MPDFLTLKYAIYFIVPAVVLFVAAYVGAGVLALTARIVVHRDVSLDTAALAMAFVISATTGMAAFVLWTTRILWAALAAGSAASFFVGAFLYSVVIKDLTPHDRKGIIAPIGLPRGSLISAVITLGWVLTVLVLWAVRQAP